MKFILETEWRDYRGKIGFKDAEERAVALISDVLLVVVNTYQPDRDFALTIAEIRKLNKAVEVLEQPPDEDDEFRFEDDHFLVLKKVVLALAPRLPLLARSSGVLEDLFEESEKRDKQDKQE